MNKIYYFNFKNQKNKKIKFIILILEGQKRNNAVNCLLNEYRETVTLKSTLQGCVTFYSYLLQALGWSVG